MGYRLSKIYTRKGDDGTTSLDARHRLPKDHSKVEALGDLDELNSAIGVVLSFKITTSGIQDVLTQVQHNLFNLSGELCVPSHIYITAEKVTQLEQWLDEWNACLPPLQEFLLPGGNPKSALCHLARTICRRAERRLVTLYGEEPFNEDILRFINRLSDLLFVAARLLAKESHATEVLWEHHRAKGKE